MPLSSHWKHLYRFSQDDCSPLCNSLPKKYNGEKIYSLSFCHMKIFGLDVEIRRHQGGAPLGSMPIQDALPKTQDKAQTPEEVKSIAYGTRYQSYDGTLIDGKTIVRNNAMFYKMYRVNTDIRAAVKAIRRTAMRDGYEYRKETKTTGESKVVQAPYFTAAIKASGGMRKIKNEIIKNFQLYGNVYILKIYNPV